MSDINFKSSSVNGNPFSSLDDLLCSSITDSCNSLQFI
jgi:hypothetical protein